MAYRLARQDVVFQLTAISMQSTFIPASKRLIRRLLAMTQFLEWRFDRQHWVLPAIGVPVILMLGLVQVDASPKALVNSVDAKESWMALNLADSKLTDQDGQQLDFASQVVGDRIVAINFIYTSCGTICPLVSATFKQVQDKLGQRLGKDVLLLSISLDPVTDTPSRLKEYAARFHAQSGWCWFTGNPQAVEAVLKSLGTTATNFRNHAPLTLVGDGKHNRWLRYNILVGGQQIVTDLESLADARKAGARSQ